MLTRKLLGVWGLGVCGAGAMLWADLVMALDDGDTKTFKVFAKVDTSRVSNANLESNSDKALDEMQTQATLLMLGGIRGRLADFQTDYSLNSRHYSEFSERNEDLLLGHSSFRIGTESRRHYLELSHSSTEIAIDPQLSDLPGNRDTRTILTANAFTSMRVGAPNLLSLQVNTSDFEFKENLESEANTVGYSTTYRRQLSPLYQLGVSASGYDLEYRYVDEKLDYSQLALFWKGELRRSHYSLTVGSNTMKRLNQTGRSPLVEVNWAYKLAAQTLSASVIQKLSDTSHGSGVTVSSSRAAGVDGRGQVRDQFKLTLVNLNWRHERLCDRCSLGVGFEALEEDYLQFAQFSSRQVSLRVATEYRLNSTVSIQLDANLGSYKATEIENNNDYTFSQTTLSASFPHLIRDGSAAIYVGALERNFELTSGYSSSFIGARFQYLLVDR